MPQLVLLRHGQSQWNLEHRFTGWVDIDLSEKGMAEAKMAGEILKTCGYTFDIAYVSVLKRAIRTLWIVLSEMDLMWLQVIKSWRLNERCYGALQGKNRKETVERYGEQQVHRWRRGYMDIPPALTEKDYRCMVENPRYAGLEEAKIPRTESLKDTLERILPLWNDSISPEIKAGKNVFIAAHRNSLRALVKHIDNLSDEDIEKIEMPTGAPLVYELGRDLKPLDHFYIRPEEDYRETKERKESNF